MSAMNTMASDWMKTIHARFVWLQSMGATISRKSKGDIYATDSQLY